METYVVHYENEFSDLERSAPIGIKRKRVTCVVVGGAIGQIGQSICSPMIITLPKIAGSMLLRSCQLLIHHRICYIRFSVRLFTAENEKEFCV